MEDELSIAIAKQKEMFKSLVITLVNLNQKQGLLENINENAKKCRQRLDNIEKKTIKERLKTTGGWIAFLGIISVIALVAGTIILGTTTIIFDLVTASNHSSLGVFKDIISEMAKCLGVATVGAPISFLLLSPIINQFKIRKARKTINTCEDSIVQSKTMERALLLRMQELYLKIRAVEQPRECFNNFLERCDWQPPVTSLEANLSLEEVVTVEGNPVTLTLGK